MTDIKICVIAWIAVALLFVVIYDFTHTGFIQKLFRRKRK